MNEAGFLTRVVALVRKETRQMLRERSSLAVGLLLPAALILLFGYGLSFDVTDAPVAVVLDERTSDTVGLVAGLHASPYLAPVEVGDMDAAATLMRAGKVAGIVHVPVDFSRRRAEGTARVQLILNGVDSNTARTVESYVTGALASSGQLALDRQAGASAMSGVTVVPRMWFNESSNSTWYLVPGLIVLVMTLIGAFLTSLLIAREWERGTLEALFVTPVRPAELLLAKLLPYLCIGAINLAICLLTARFLFEVPMRGSLLAVVVSSMLYLGVSLLLGLFISGVTRNQFQASQVALLTSFMPAMMLSGFVFDLRNMPVVIQVISQLLPATHFMGLIKTLFLAGDNWPLFFQKSGILILYGVLLFLATRRTLRKRLA